MKQLYSLLLFLFFVHTIWANEWTLHHELNWKSPITIEQDNGEQVTVVSFDGAQLDNETLLPLFTERIYLGKNKMNIKASIKNAVYEIISSADIQKIKNLSNLSSSILINSRTSIARKSFYGNVSFIPLRINQITGQYEKLKSFDLVINTNLSPSLSPSTNAQDKLREGVRKKNKSYSNSSILATGNWYKLAIDKKGVYWLTYDDLVKLGMDVSQINPENIRIYGNGGGMLSFSNSAFRYDDLQENAISVSDGGDGKFDNGDYILFYAQNANVWAYNTSDKHYHHTQNLYSDSTYYFITADLGAGKRISTAASSGTATATVTTYDDYAYHEKEEVNILSSGRFWYGELFDLVTQYQITDFNFSNIDTSVSAYAKVQVLAAATSASSFNVDVNGLASESIGIAAISGSEYEDHAATTSKGISFTPDSSYIPISINYNKSTATAIGWLDYIEMNVRRKLIFYETEQLQFRDAKSVLSGQISNFQITDYSGKLNTVWEITDPLNVKKMPLTFSDSIVDLIVATDSLREFIAFGDSSLKSPTLLGNVENQDLHSIGIDENGNPTKVDMIIVAYPEFLDQAQQLASFHEQKDSLTVRVVTTRQVYNEFSSGAQDVCAIRDFMKMLYDRADSAITPSYLLLFGDGSYDPKNRMPGNTNDVITFENDISFNPLYSYTSDDFFVLWDDDEGDWDYKDAGDLDAGVGRFPVKTKEEAQIAVNKVIQYYDVSTMGDWRNMLCFIADDEDNNKHLSQANGLADYVQTNYPQFNIDKIFLDAYEQTFDASGYHFYDATAAINNRVNKGTLIINYTGHGGTGGLAHERVIQDAEIEEWNNIDNMPIFFTASCEVSRFDDPELTSAGEHMFLNENGGSIALFSTVRVVNADPNYQLNLDFYKTVFEKEKGKYASLGEIFMNTKNRSGVNDNSKNFALLGDPALKIAIPEYDVKTLTINTHDVAVIVDTLKALSKVTVSGFVADGNGDTLLNYNGTLYPTVYDKTKNIPTLANDNTSVATTFSLQNSILFKGKASVVDGKFSFSFMVPKDIVSTYGNGKFSYYLTNGENDGSGYFNTFIIGGTNTNAVADTKGPDVKLYMNDEKFIFGDVTNNSPLLLAFMCDSNGINTVGNGIGHDILATLDDNTENTQVLNDVYVADINSYQSGSAQYAYSNLSTGRHSIEVKAWDVYDNPSVSYTEFIVAETADIALKHVLNYPNPFTSNTNFIFEHNQPGISITVQVQIFTVSGKLIKTLNISMQTDDIHSDPILWDGKDDYGDAIGKGVYIYRLTAQTPTSKAEQIEKLVLLK